MRTITLLPLSVLGLMLVGCGDKPDANDPSKLGTSAPCAPGQICTQQPGYGQPGSGYGQPGYGQPGYGQPVPPTQPTQPVQPTPPAQPQPTSAGQATAIPPMAAMLADPILKGLASKDLPGMSAEGGPIVANYQQGQTFEQAFQMQPGRCYGVIAVGMPGLTEVDAMFQSNLPPAPSVTMAQDATTGSNAMIGQSNGCYRNATPVPVPAKLVIRATGGAGIVMAQLFVK